MFIGGAGVGLMGVGIPEWAAVGSSLSITAATPSICAMTSSRIAFYDSSNDSLRAYDFDGSNWSLTGSGLSVTNATNPRLAAMTSSRVALYDPNIGSLRAYDFNGSTWSLTGSGLAVTSGNSVAMCRMTDSRIAFAYDSDGDGNSLIRAYDFDGSNWSATGSDLTITSSGAGLRLASMKSDRVALRANSAGTLQAYDFNGSTWSATGSATSGFGGNFDLCRISDDTIVTTDSSVDNLQAYKFNGSSWSAYGDPLSLTAYASNPTVAPMTATRIAFFDTTNDLLKAYDFV